MNVLELCRDLVRIPSLSGEEEGCVALLADRLREFDPTVSGRNVFAVRGDGPRTLLLNSHTDTVPASDEWTCDPHAAELRDGRIYGLGANDAKGPLAALTVAFCTARLPAGARLVLAATCEEETGGDGLGVLRPELPAIDAAVIGEPTALQVCTAQRGMLRVRVRVPGKRAHAARPWQGDNAIFKAGRDIRALEEIELPEPHPILGPPTLQVTVITGGVKVNVVPPECSFEVDARTLPAMDNRTLLERIRAAVQGEVSLISDRFVPVETATSEPIVQAALQASGAAEPVAFGGVSDLFHVRDVPGIVLGPGRSEQSHAADEWMETDMLERGAEVYRAVVERYFA